MDRSEQLRLLEMAAGLAAEHHPHPNPRVGAVVVDAAGGVVGTGAHLAKGTPHAEVHALAEAGDRADGGTVVVTLEPCVHRGSTPPCTEALIDAGVATVVVGAIDPDPRVTGAGVATLRASGIDVIVVADQERFEAVDPGYFHHRRTGRPRVTLKLAMTIDGQIAAADRTSRWITSEEARADAHAMRSRSDGVLVGVGTVIADDPRLDVRLGSRTGPQPRPVVVVGRRSVPPDAAVLRCDPIVYGPMGSGAGVEVGEGEAVDLGAMLADLGRRNIVDLLVEGGSTIAGALHRGDHIDRYVVYLAASVAGGIGVGAFGGVFETLSDRVGIEFTAVERVGPDLRIDAVARRSDVERAREATD